MTPLTEYINDGNVRRFLDMLSAAEGTKTHGYNTLFGGNRFDSLTDHPRQSFQFNETTGKKNRTDAAGRYQFLSSTWDEQAKKLGLKDFSPMSQDLATINLLKERGILPHVLNGNWDTAIQMAGPIWASLPSSPYPQPRRSREFVMASLNNPPSPSSAPSSNVSIEAITRALGKARAANDDVGTQEIEALLRSRFVSARKRAEAANDTVGMQEIDASLQQLLMPPAVAAPGQAVAYPVAPPGPVEVQELPPLEPGAAPMGTPSQAPDFDPSQRDMGGLGTPAAVPEAPVAPVAPQVVPTPQLAPAAAPAPRSTAEIVSGETAPVVTLPTTTVTGGPQRNLTDQGFESDPTWIGNAKKLYQETEGKPFEGADADAAKWLKNYVAQTKWNMGSAGLTIYDAMTKLSPEGKSALLQSIKEYGDAPTSGESVLRGLKGIATDPTTYLTAGAGNLITKTIGKKGAEVALRKAIEEGIKKQTFSTATKQAAASGAGYGAAGNALEQGVQVAADGQEAIDPTQVATSAAGGAVVGAGASKIIDKLTGRGAVRDLAAKSGTIEDLATNAEIINKLKAESQNPAREIFGSTPNLQRREVNARVTTDIVDEARKVVNSLPNDFPNKAQLVEATKKGINSSQRMLADLAEIPGGAQVVDIINKATRADRLTAPNPSSQNFLLRGARTASDLLLPGVISKPVNYMLKPRSSSEDVTRKLIDQFGPAADKVMGLGVESYGSQGLRSLQEIARNAATESTARRATAVEQKAAEALAKKTAQEQAKAAAAAESAASRNSVLQATGMPLGGPFQELLQGGRSGLNMTSDQAIEALRIAAQKNKDNPVGVAANQVRRSSPEGVTDTNAFYGLQNELRKLQERGVLGGQPGALSSVTQGSGIRNPISYAANVRTAEAALKVAQESAPSNALAQFANVVAGLKSPEAKAALVQQRLMRTKDPVEVEYLTNFIEPLTRFGAKSK